MNQEENDHELHFILFLFILLIRQTASDGNPFDHRRQLVVVKELGVPISRVNLINGDTLQNVIVKIPGDLVIFQNPLNQTGSNVAIVSWGAFYMMTEALLAAEPFSCVTIGGLQRWGTKFPLF